MRHSTVQCPLRHLWCTLEMDREKREKGWAAVLLKVKWGTHHMAFTGLCLLSAPSVVEHTEEIGSCCGTGCTSWSATYPEFRLECHPDGPRASEQRQKHLLLLHLRRISLLQTLIWRPLWCLSTTVWARGVSRSAPGGETCDVILCVGCNASLSAQCFIHPPEVSNYRRSLAAAIYGHNLIGCQFNLLGCVSISCLLYFMESPEWSHLQLWQ